ncbi:Tannase and feruloyl esterase [Brevundimonas diminuta]|jgi:feruloyl esterase|uniref:Tannase and feruloyl esterase n=2 Tax=Brevundimonas diminuta TaxID=293 RepID=A0A246KNG1_BREDI|nr:MULTISPECIES: tannase/feruloyl esterase family alpha/beta hydrolase [Brevundimonas]MBD3832576.1 tannase/feruloyl esterase family alpha/beta hydrolase [Brevundimonas sp.]MBD3574538.1 tannase/feruloyl esterase family alpha/beta hydrolase [Brevundimonas diminuta]MBI2249543.1 tannase/feruloyl esterase family alpha/beta hydrolase [Brevundimonas diminuta]MDM8351461.1 tannase/feruloyl esterase family alpha/beta hydrolase [Brevundimonas diminuta]OWR24566.1 hypothetical protein CD944_01425 [Brevundi
MPDDATSPAPRLHRRIGTRPMLAGASAITFLVGTAEASAPDSATQCRAMAEQHLPGARVIEATVVPAGELAVPGQAAVGDLPTLCRIQGVAEPTDRSRIGFEVWMPLAAWNGRIHMVGNGGYSSSIRYNLMGNLVRRGDVAVATDTGHVGDDLEFGFDNREAIADWGHRAVHESIRAGKALTQTYYGAAPRQSYFSGCSTGGHQGLTAAQRYPGDFDGIIAGAPGANRTNLNFGFLWQFLQNHAPGDNLNPILTRADLQLVSRKALRDCDGLDGVADGIVVDPRRCTVDLADLRCRPGEEAATCLTDRKISALSGMRQGARRADTGETIYPAWPVGSEYVEGQGLAEGWDVYWANPRKPDEPQRIDYFRRWSLNDPEWNWWSFDWSTGVDRIRAAMAPLTDAVNPDLSAFRARGGKLILFIGWQDPVVSAYDTIDYFDRVIDTAGGDVSDFAQLYLVPGMGHCALGGGATNFSTSTRNSMPLVADADHDMSLALERWVEEGVAPRRIVAARYRGSTPASGVELTRPLCPYPAVPVYDGRGDPALASSHQCRPPT